MDRLAIRLECIKAASHLYSGSGSFTLDERVLEAAQKFEQYVNPRPEQTGLGSVPDHPEVAVVHDPQGNLVSSSDDFPVDLTGYTLRFEGKPAHVHHPRQHRDRKAPWCDHCGLTAHLLVPKVNPFDRDKEDQ